MPPLNNSKQERFCIEVASGCSLVEAYHRAGYSKNTNSRSNSCKLAKQPQIKYRLDELKKRREDEFILTRKDILMTLGKIANDGADSNKIKACQLIAHMQGYLEDTLNIRTDDIKELSDEDLREFIKNAEKHE